MIRLSGMIPMDVQLPHFPGTPPAQRVPAVLQGKDPRPFDPASLFHHMQVLPGEHQPRTGPSQQHISHPGV